MSAIAIPLPLGVAARLDGAPLLLFLDIDGTVSAIAARPI
jgi:trehalose-6-phosphatase